MDDRNCQSCRFFCKHLNYSGGGECRYDPPTITITPTRLDSGNGLMARCESKWPTVSEYSWCGKFSASTTGTAVPGGTSEGNS